MATNPLVAALMSGNPQMTAMRSGLSSAPLPASPKANAFAIPAPQAPRPVVSINGPKTDALARALMADAASARPTTPFEALGKLAQLWSGNRQQEKFIEAEAARAEAKKQADEQEMMGKLGKFKEIYDQTGDPFAASTATGLGADFALKSLFEKQQSQAPIKVGPNETVLDPVTMQPMFTGPGAVEKPEIKEVNGRLIAINPDMTTRDITPADLPSGYRPATPEERASYSVQPGVPLVIGPDGKPNILSSAGTTVNIENKAEGEEAKARGKATAEHFGKLAEDLPAADQLVQSVGQLSSLLETTDVGAVPALLEGVRKATGIALGPQADKRQAVESLVDYLTPRMRVPGSGATSDMEMRTFKNSLPTLMGTPGGNKIITNTLAALAQRRVAMAQIAQDYLTGAVDAPGAIAQMRALPDAFAEFKMVAPRLTSPNPSAATASPTNGGKRNDDTPPAGITADEWKFLKPEERAKFR